MPTLYETENLASAPRKGDKFTNARGETCTVQRVTRWHVFVMYRLKRKHSPPVQYSRKDWRGFVVRTIWTPGVRFERKGGTR